MTLAVLGFSSRLYFLRTPSGDFRAPRLHQRIDALFEPHVGEPPTPELIAALQADADTLFRDVVTGMGLVPHEWRLLVHVDDVLGPVPRLHGPGGQSLHVAEFEQRLREGKIELPTG